MPPKGRILISVTNKTGLEKWGVLAEAGWEIISTGGTAKALKGFGIPVTEVGDVTKFPEMLDGRLKTLHPAIHGGILARRDLPDHMSAIESAGIKPIDVVVVNLYDFAGKPDIENIDIGGPALLRAAAKNVASVLPVVDPEDYDWVIAGLIVGDELHYSTLMSLSREVFRHTSKYDEQIAEWLERGINREVNLLVSRMGSSH